MLDLGKRDLNSLIEKIDNGVFESDSDEAAEEFDEAVNSITTTKHLRKMQNKFVPEFDDDEIKERCLELYYDVLANEVYTKKRFSKF
ncbi:hypothetical protein MY04_05925 (plasmid) [Flammeovirga sp. MY04]|uniref:hypothetical protein n=1 Tax=Flammeovirga sp. MY04 TaxID=1191459 RepID=UPI00080610EA|nr:hypothetical protein [Flammeovirga sp. MY04]ANQ52917.1 hypothetical protein MY04_05925 [Flammeovirga sp. MY04]